MTASLGCSSETESVRTVLRGHEVGLLVVPIPHFWANAARANLFPVQWFEFLSQRPYVRW